MRPADDAGPRRRPPRLPLGEQAERLFAMACKRGLGALDDGAVFELLRKR